MKKVVYVKDVAVGSGPIKIQSMTNTPTADVAATLMQIARLKAAGADMVRVSVPDAESAKAFKELVKCGVPLIADAHYSHIPALIAIENGAHKVRINPGNMSEKSLREVAKAAAERNIPIRVGVNKGSVKGAVTPRGLAELTLDWAKRIEDFGLDKLVLAVKTSDVKETVLAYRELSKMCDYPLHIGLTEAGTRDMGMIKSAVAIGSLLIDGIGDTVRVSLAADPVEEIYAAKKLLRASGADCAFVNVIACPTCARTKIPVVGLAEKLEQSVKDLDKSLTVAVMGCAVNGIGEGERADFGVAGGEKESILFSRGQVIGKIQNDKILEKLIELTREYK